MGPAADLADLANLSHAVERLALALCVEDDDDRRIEHYIQDFARGEREAVAVALSYALRRRELDGSTPLLDRAVALLASTVRRMAVG
ncbi:MAG: hypothetical protein QOF60_2892 [Actinomycetota bacterium]|jgi:hypothetical protein|nr:hypothetical protein [Actinomycetota bacterium]